MLTMRALICSIAVTSFAAAAAAQTKAVVVDQRTIMEAVAGKTDTILSRTVTSKERVRVDYISSVCCRYVLSAVVCSTATTASALGVARAGVHVVSDGMTLRAAAHVVNK
jgi:hypothetical protein